MSTRKSSVFYGFLIALASLVVGMVIASRLDLTPASQAGSLNIPATNSAPLTGALDATTFRNIARDTSPAVVSVLTRSKRPMQTMQFFGLDPFGGGQQGGGANRRRQQQQQELVPVEGAGSGYVIDKAGFILTNNHVVEDAEEIYVKFQDMDALEDGLHAKVVGRDVLTDSALLQLTEMRKQPLTEVKFGDSSQIQPGDWVVAIGNPYRFSNTVTVGVVSAVDRTPPDLAPVPGRDLEFIQTDAAINRGNSGGPLLNIRGEVIGTNTAIVSDGNSGNIGLGFAVPINTITEILPGLKAGKVVRGRIGVQVSKFPMTAEDAKDFGLPAPMGTVVDTVGDGPARAAGIKPGDVILEFNAKPVKNSADLVSMVVRTAPGTTVPVKIARGGKTQTLNVKVEELNLEAEQAQTPRGTARPQQQEQPTPTGFGMSIGPLSPDVAQQMRLPAGRGGAVVTQVTPGQAASQAGLAGGDVILAVNGQEVTSVADAEKALGRVETRHSAGLLLWRQGQGEVFVQVRKR